MMHPLYYHVGLESEAPLREDRIHVQGTLQFSLKISLMIVITYTFVHFISYLLVSKPN